MKIIGLTGGIGSGKSTVSEYLASKGIKIIDADRISHEITEKGSPILPVLAGSFGSDIINADGSLNRKLLAARAFASEESGALLNGIMHGAIFELTDSRIAAIEKEGKDGIVFLDAPLLFEAGMDAKADETWLVHADKDIRIERVKRRDNLSEAEIIARMERQMSDEEKLSRADCVLDNSGTTQELYAQVDELLEALLTGCGTEETEQKL